MDLSTDIIGNLSGQSDIQENKNKYEFSILPECPDILDLSGLDLDNEETWLCEAKQKSGMNYRIWLHGNLDNAQIPQQAMLSNLKSTKAIDTRTFTRPKKKILRPSIIDYDQLYISGSDSNDAENNTSSKLSEIVRKELELASREPKAPLHFDLSQPTSLHNFDSFMVNSADSFQNMSPPSLVNSLCSSTFANLMENSFIKNDPVLREIRDKDFTDTVLLQDTEAPMFQSISESCCSLNSDTPENFLKKVSFNGTFRKNDSNNSTLTPEKSFERNSESSVLNETFDIQKNAKPEINNSVSSTENLELTQTKEGINTTANHNLNGTYRRTPKRNVTFRKSDNTNRLSLNLTYEANALDKDISKSIETDMNKSNKGNLDNLNLTRTKSSTTVISLSDSIENLKKSFVRSSVNMDLNRLSYCMDEKVNQINTSYKEENSNSEWNKTIEMKRSSLGSTDSLDRMSSLSSSSKGSNKMLNMADVDAIVEMKERSMSHMMSTPKISSGVKKLWENNFISPIVDFDNERHFYGDELKNVESKMSNDKYIKHSAKLMIDPGNNKNLKLKTTQRSSYALPNQRPLQVMPSNIRASYSNISNLKTTTSTMGGSQSNLYKPARNMIRPPSATNLKTMGTKLKGSYTSLKPISANLPVAPPLGSTVSVTHTVTRPSVIPSSKTEVMLPKEKLVSAPGDGTFMKPSRISSLPRPTGIPRPATRMPVPRSNIRPSCSRGVNY